MYRLLRNLSLDVALGSCCMMWLVSAYLHVNISPRFYFLLALVVWLVYTTDHLIDAAHTEHEASTPRHRFHQQHFRILAFFTVAGLVTGIFMIPGTTPEMLFYGGLILSGFILLYFISLVWARKTSFRYVLKELFIAAVYTAGISFVPIYYSLPDLDTGIFFFIFRIFSIALANLLLFSLIEQKHDLTDEHPSAIKWFGLKTVRNWIQFLLWLNLSLGFSRLFFVDSTHLVYILTLSIMDLSLLYIYYRRDRMLRNELYRVVGDGIFFLPVLIWLYERIQ